MRSGPEQRRGCGGEDIDELPHPQNLLVQNADVIIMPHSTLLNLPHMERTALSGAQKALTGKHVRLFKEWQAELRGDLVETTRAMQKGAFSQTKPRQDKFRDRELKRP